jgi:murein DD-endopeptidase MepM/ murein hydrolase activator NlpD
MEVLDLGKSEATGSPVKSLTKNRGFLGKGFVYPVSGTVSSVQGLRNGKMHNGCDIAAGAGTPIYAAEDGVVAANQFQAGGGGWMIVLKHPDGLYTNYFHQLVQSSLRVGTKVSKGDQIGVVGSTGGSTGNHLHFEVCTGLFSGRLTVSTYFPDMGIKSVGIVALKSVGR